MILLVRYTWETLAYRIILKFLSLPPRNLAFAYFSRTSPSCPQFQWNILEYQSLHRFLEMLFIAFLQPLHMLSLWWVTSPAFSMKQAILPVPYLQQLLRSPFLCYVVNKIKYTSHFLLLLEMFSITCIIEACLQLQVTENIPTVDKHIEVCFYHIIRRMDMVRCWPWYNASTLPRLWLLPQWVFGFSLMGIKWLLEL